MIEKKSEKRNLGLEWLRICSMFMIILLHSIDHSGLYETLEEGAILYVYEQFIYALVQVCVNCFVLISGYFLVQSQFKLRKLISLWIEVFFYSFSIKLIMMVTGEITFSIASLISCFVPILTGRYWFITIYFGMYLMFPFYNIAIKAMNEQQHKRLVVLLIVLFSVMISIYPSFKGMNSGGAWGLAWFTVLYFIAAYFRIYYVPDKKKKCSLVLFFVIPIIMTLALVTVQKMQIGVLSNMVKNWWRYDSFPVVIASIALFVTFIKMEGKALNRRGNQLVIKISGTTLGVYLIHAHANICTEVMWQRLGIVSNLSHWWFPIYQLVIVGIIFLVCSMIDCCRQRLFTVMEVDKFSIRMETLLKNRTNVDNFFR
ncbi:acyltransferase [Bariatricus sp. HCP28S3_D3]|uniref:acyltransferase n=1 Tax=Bariatricus sp. HCP28S3_D3 TaxID=3438901 RepID=UPI003F8C75F0